MHDITINIPMGNFVTKLWQYNAIHNTVLKNIIGYVYNSHIKS